MKNIDVIRQVNITRTSVRFTLLFSTVVREVVYVYDYFNIYKFFFVLFSWLKKANRLHRIYLVACKLFNIIIIIREL